jgi:hypothetical protein
MPFHYKADNQIIYDYFLRLCKQFLLIYTRTNGTSNFKIVIATRGDNIYKYKKTKNKILNYNINIFFTQIYSSVNSFYLLF